MKYILAFIAVFLLISCKKDSTTAVEQTLPAKTSTDSLAGPATKTPKPEVVIEKNPLYAAEWVADLEASNYPESLKVVDNYILVDKDTAYFPEYLKLNKGYHLTAFTDTNFYQLDVTRINLTSVEYDFTLMENEKEVLKKHGTAHLGGLFFLGAESFDDDKTGDAYLGDEYCDKTGGSCFSIVIAEPDGQNRINAVVNLCDGRDHKTVNKDITLRQSL